MLLESIDGIAERPGLPFILRPVARRIVAGRMRTGAIRHQFDQRRAGTASRAFSGPLRDGIRRQEIIAVDTHAGDAVSRAARGKGLRFAAGESLEGRDGPLVVHDIQQHRCAIDRSERQRMMKVCLGGRTFAGPCCGDVILAANRCGHGPADGLRHLRGQIARHRKNIAFAPVIHDRHLPALAHVVRVRQTLAHQVDDIAPARDLQSLRAIRRKEHVGGSQRHRLCDGHRFLAGGLHVERNAPLALHSLHAFVVGARHHHVTQADMQIGRVQMRIPGADRAMLVVEHAYQSGRQWQDVGQRRIRIRSRHGAGRGQCNVTEIRGVARPRRRMRNMQV